MARHHAKASPGAASSANSQGASGAHVAGKATGKQDKHGIQPRTSSHLFSKVAGATAHFAGQPLAFLTAVAVVVIWALTGPLFGFSDTWQLVINTSTTIVTFLMVFLLQHTQNRDALALQLKLAELTSPSDRRRIGSRLSRICRRKSWKSCTNSIGPAPKKPSIISIDAGGNSSTQAEGE